MSEDNLRDVIDGLPFYLTRKDVGKFFGNIISPKYLANLDSEGKGPKRFKIGNKAVYPSTEFVEWLYER